MEIKSRVPGKIVRFEKQIGDSVEVKEIGRASCRERV